jgi:hypothetical protein
LFEANLGSDCSDSKKPELVVASLKAIGNIGSFANAGLLNACLDNKKNSFEVRVSAIQAFRRFSCSTLGAKFTSLRKVFADQSEDTEVRINAFQVGIKCSDDEKVRTVIESGFPQIIEKETNVQVLSTIRLYFIRYYL